MIYARLFKEKWARHDHIMIIVGLNKKKKIQNTKLGYIYFHIKYLN